MKSGKKRNKPKTPQYASFKQIQLRGEGSGWGGESRFHKQRSMSFTLSPMGSHLRGICCYSKIISTEKISRNNNNTATEEEEWLNLCTQPKVRN